MAKNYNRDIIKLITEKGCRFVRHGKGDHDIWYSPITGRNFTVDGNIKSKELANAIMKQSGVKHKF